ncbi:Uncharacterised protein [Chlamydia abortus]|nr:Uncharacterised protein [Chlamydia abortus]
MGPHLYTWRTFGQKDGQASDMVQILMGYHHPNRTIFKEGVKKRDREWKQRGERKTGLYRNGPVRKDGA